MKDIVLAFNLPTVDIDHADPLLGIAIFTQSNIIGFVLVEGGVNVSGKHYFVKWITGGESTHYSDLKQLLSRFLSEGARCVQVFD